MSVPFVAIAGNNICVGMVESSSSSGTEIVGKRTPFLKYIHDDKTRAPLGFELLCRLMSTPPSKLQLFPHNRSVNVGGEIYPVESTLAVSSDVIVSKIVINNEPWAVKTARYPAAVRLQRTFESEVRIMKDLSKTQFRRYLPKLLDANLPRNNAIAMNPVGVDLNEFCVNADPGTLFAPLFVKVIDALECLHKCKWYHGDVRFQNVIVHNDNIYLIDYETAAPSDSRRSYLTGPYCFIASNMLLPNFSDNYYSVWNDLESFAYNMLFLLKNFNVTWVSPLQDAKRSSLEIMVKGRDADLGEFKDLQTVVKAIQSRRSNAYNLFRDYCRSFPAQAVKLV